jgi:hypothetical protein
MRKQVRRKVAGLKSWAIEAVRRRQNSRRDWRK